MALHDNLKKIREERKLTKKELCEKTGITERAYLTYEFGEREPKVGVIAKLADFYGVTTDYLLGRETPNPLDMLNLNNLEKLILQTYISVSPKTRKELEEVIMKIADGADLQIVAKKPEIQQNTNSNPMVYCGTIGEELERRKSEEEATRKDTAFKFGVG